jgi:hypothetical protein
MPESSTSISLYGIANDLITDTAPQAVNNHNYIINNVSPDLRIEASCTMVSSVLGKLFQTIIRHTQNSVILISAKAYGMTVLVQGKSKGTISPGLPEDIGHACLKAQKTGGVIEMLQCENNQASIAYCFLNVAGAA